MRVLLPLLALLAGFAAMPAAHADCVTGDAIFGHPELKTQRYAFQAYEIHFYGGQDCAAEPESRIAGLEILKAGKRIYMQTGYSFALGYPLEQDQSPDSVKLEIGTDLTGEGQPDLLVSEWTGGSHCCYRFHLFQLGPEFRTIQTLPLFDADESAFVRRAGVKGLVLNTVDYSAFAYFPKSFAGSPAGRVFLSFKQGRFRLDPTLMRAAGPDKSTVTRCAALFKKSRAWKDAQPMGMWYYATDLIYTGNQTAAYAFLEQSWGGSSADRDKYLGEYRRRLMKSIYYPELKLLQSLGDSASNQKIDWTKQCYAYLEG